MAGLSAINSKMKYLSSVTIDRVHGRAVSVVHYDPADPDNVDFPENCNERGVLLVPRPLTERQWVEKYGSS